MSFVATLYTHPKLSFFWIHSQNLPFSKPHVFILKSKFSKWDTHTWGFVACKKIEFMFFGAFFLTWKTITCSRIYSTFLACKKKIKFIIILWAFSAAWKYPDEYILSFWKHVQPIWVLYDFWVVVACKRKMNAFFFSFVCSRQNEYFMSIIEKQPHIIAYLQIF